MDLALLSSVAADGTAPDLFAVGLVLAIIGCFLLANSILFRHPRTLVAQFFGREAQPLTSIRAYIFHRVQVHLGFLFLLVGFGLQLFGHFRPTPPGGEEFPFAIVGYGVLAVVALELLGWWLSHLLFKRYVREYFVLHPPNLEADVALSRQLGDLFGIPSQGDDSVQSYLLRIRQRIGIVGPRTSMPAPPARAARVGLDEAEVEEEFGLSS